VRNGPIECLFAEFATVEVVEAARPAAAAAPEPSDSIGVPLRNRLLKNNRHLQRWARRNDVSCYRVYDADLPEFSFALDRYQSEVAPDLEWFHLQEYQAPASIDAATAEYRIGLAQEVVKSAFELPDDRLFCKTRSRQRGNEQYQKQDNRGEFFQVREAAASVLINLSDYLDSGLFLDHRLTRDRVYQLSQDKRVLNLFCYTGVVGVLAALGGAAAVVNVDLSASYLKWARENHLLNQLEDEQRFQFIRADIVELLAQPARFSLQPDFDLIFLDPPSFSNSSKMRQTLDIQRDHVDLLRSSMALLKADGLLLFSTNRRGFKLSPELTQTFDITDITRQTIPEDFKRNQKIHACWEVRHRNGQIAKDGHE
jgi:23S rRNA (guanine2445-N2)-methyltransferase / 23S rRNA (guanine2069-N7)-methyltransferase